MSTGQIAQRPYSSFRTKYAINSSPVLGPRMSSYTNKSRNVPLRPISSTTNKTTDDLLKPLNKTYSKSANNNGDRTTTASNGKPETTSKTTKTTTSTSSSASSTSSSTSSWNNKLFYSSTRTYASKSFNFIENNKLMNKNRASSTTIHSKSPNSSGTSVESIVPKYGQSISSNGQSKSVFNGSQKRAYNTAKPLKENVPNVNGHKKTLISNHTTSANTTNRKHIKENVNTFSSKFPNGLPFEDEFYRKGRSYSGASDASKVSSYSSYNDQSLPFEDEFSRKPSNEPLYVDFTKSIPINTKQQKMHLNANYFNKFDNISRDSNKSHDQPVVYVAVASWVPKCNEFHSKEPMTKDCM